MVLGLLAGAAVGAHAVFNYNRKNFLFDQKLRQEQEFTILEYRNAQAELWRDDVRELIGMTEKKMESYTLVAALMLDMCVGMFAKGRLEPGTPPWLLHFFMLSLGGAFTYLSMSLWFAVHASVAANCSSVRLLTQFVRLPVPTWEQLEDARTYASAFERLKWTQVLRVPFSGGAGRVDQVTQHTEHTAAAGTSITGAGKGENATRGSGSTHGLPKVADPWGLECHGRQRGLEELEAAHPATRPHIALARHAMEQYQCYDASARLSMSFGVQQLLNAIVYYCIGYASVQDGAVWPAWCIAATVAVSMMSLVMVDFSTSAMERSVLHILVVAGPVSCASASTMWTLRKNDAESPLMWLLSVAYASHGLWLAWALITCGFKRHHAGLVIPSGLRAVLYLDVFGWLREPPEGQQAAEQPPDRERGGMTDDMPSLSGSPHESSNIMGRQRCSVLGRGLHIVRTMAHAAAQAFKHFVDMETGSDYSLVLTVSDAETIDDSRGAPSLSSRGLRGTTAVKAAPKRAFSPLSYFPDLPLGSSPTSQGAVGKFIMSADRMQPGHFPSKLFNRATVMLIVLWAMGLVLPFEGIKQLMIHAMLGKVIVEEAHRREARSGAFPSFIRQGPKELQRLADGVVVEVEWPKRAGFFPHALGSDPFCRQLVVADGVGLYLAQLNATTAVAAGGRATRGARVVRFQHTHECAGVVGQGLKDLSVGCIASRRDAQQPLCSVFVLTGDGQRLLQCQLSAESNNDGPKRRAPDMASAPSWTISRAWLHSERGERIESLAVDDQCLQEPLGQESASVFEASRVGCVIVGTTLGRIVQLRGSLEDKRTLVPERSLQWRMQAISHGSLHVLPSGAILALRRNALRGRPAHGSDSISTSVLGIDGEKGSLVGEWQLPSSTDWLSLSGGRGCVLGVGLRNLRHLELHRFPAPPELSEARG